MNTNEQIALVALNRMFQKGHMDICAIRDVAAILKVNPEAETFAQLRALHCVDWKDMPRDLYRKIPDMIKTCLGGEVTHRFVLADDEPKMNLTTVAIAETRPEPKRPLLSRWLGG